MGKQQLQYGDVTEAIIQAYYHVYNSLGYGFLEKVYENALKVALTKQGFQVSQQVPIDVYFDGEQVGSYFADLVVNGVVIVEIKAAEILCSEHEAQLVNYLNATTIEVGLLLNFGEKPEFKRKVFSNDRKPQLKGMERG